MSPVGLKLHIKQIKLPGMGICRNVFPSQYVPHAWRQEGSQATKGFSCLLLFIGVGLRESLLAISFMVTNQSPDQMSLDCHRQKEEKVGEPLTPFSFFVLGMEVRASHRVGRQVFSH